MIALVKMFLRTVGRLRLRLHKRDLLRTIDCGEGLDLEGRILVVNPEKLSIGDNVHIGSGCYLHCRGGITVGNNTMISRNVTIYSYDHDIHAGSELPFGAEIIERPVVIGNCVWIGMNVTIAPGTTIGDGAVVGIGAVISGAVGENEIVVSAKHRVVGRRDPERTKRLMNARAFFKPGK